MATSPSLCAVMAKWNKLIGGHFQPLPLEASESTISDLFAKEEIAALVFYFYANAMNMEMVLAKLNRGGITDTIIQHYDSMLRQSAVYLTVLGNLTMPRRLGERFFADLS